MWFLESSVRQAMEQAIKAGMVPSAESQATFMTDNPMTVIGETPRIMTVAGNNAEISVKGVLTQAPSFFAFLFGGGNTTYSEIIASIQIADQSEDITSITLAIDSPGGEFAGLFDAIDAIKTADTPIKAVISNLGASAAYAIASQADEIVASNRAARIGSVGVVSTFFLSDDEISITSTAAPKKRPDLTTEEGRAIVREELDALHEIFVGAIAEGRGATIETINAKFGQGGTLLSDEALNRGMIDSVAGSKLTKVVDNTKTKAVKGANKQESEQMDKEKLKAEHPDVYAAIEADVLAAERDRVGAHLHMGEQSGDMKTAVGAIADGSEMTQTLTSKYMTAGMNRQDKQDLEGDDAGTEAALGGASGSDEADAPADVVAGMVETGLGIKGSNANA